jgi:hypothetical protein
MERLRDDRVKQVAIGVGILMTLAVVVPGTLMGWRYLPGLLGEWIGTMIGIMTTPFFMEASFLILGLVTVIALNYWRTAKEGDEFVYLEQVAGPDLPKDLPDQARWAVYLEKPLAVETPSSLAMAEGAFAIGDYPAASEWIGTMNQDDLKRPATLRLRLELARATGKNELVERLEKELTAAESAVVVPD